MLVFDRVGAEVIWRLVIRCYSVLRMAATGICRRGLLVLVVLGVIVLSMEGVALVVEAEFPAEDFADDIAREIGGKVGVDMSIDAEDALSEVRNDAEIVGDGKNGEALFEGLDCFEELGLDGEIDICGGFVEEEELGIANEGAGDEDALALAAGELCERVAGLVDEIHAIKGLQSGFFVGPGVAAADMFVNSAHEDDIAGGDGKFGIVLKMLRHIADARGRVAGGGAKDGYRASVGFEEAEDEFEESGFATAVGANDAEGLARGDAERRVFDNGDIGIVGERNGSEGYGGGGFRFWRIWGHGWVVAGVGRVVVGDCCLPSHQPFVRIRRTILDWLPIPIRRVRRGKGFVHE